MKEHFRIIKSYLKIKSIDWNHLPEKEKCESAETLPITFLKNFYLFITHFKHQITLNDKLNINNYIENVYLSG
jgi:hypothetical protein